MNRNIALKKRSEKYQNVGKEINREWIAAQYELNRVDSLNENEKRILCDCYALHESADQAAEKMDISISEARMWYYRITMAAARNALQEANR